MKFSVTVMEYKNSTFLSLNSDDLDQLLRNNPMEECMLCIDTFIGKALEMDLVASCCKNERDLSEYGCVLNSECGCGY